MARVRKQQQVTVTTRSRSGRKESTVLEKQGKKKIAKEDREKLKAERKHDGKRIRVGYRVRALSEKLGITFEEAEQRIKSEKKVKLPKRKFRWRSSKKEDAVLTYGEKAIRTVVSGGGGPGTGKKR